MKQYKLSKKGMKRLDADNSLPVEYEGGIGNPYLLTERKYGSLSNIDSYYGLKLGIAPSYERLNFMYRSVPMFRRAIRIPVQDALSNKVTIFSTDTKQEDIDKVYKYFLDNDLWTTIIEFQSLVRLHGGAAIIIEPGDDILTELTPAVFQQFKDVRYFLVPQNLVNLESGRTNQQGDKLIGYKDLFIHPSRVIIGRGDFDPSGRMNNQRWGLSKGEEYLDVFDSFIHTSSSRHSLLDQSRQRVFQLNNLNRSLKNKTTNSTIRSKIEQIDQNASSHNAIVLDSDDTFSQMTYNFAGLADMAQQERFDLAAAVGIPQKKLFGEVTAGLASGESDLKVYNQMLVGEIQPSLRKVITELISIAFAVTFDNIPEDFQFEFNQVEVFNEQERSTLKTTALNRVIQTLNSGIITREKAIEILESEGIYDVSLDDMEIEEPVVDEDESIIEDTDESEEDENEST